MVNIAPNTQPIYPRRVFVWKKILISDVIVGKKITTQNPILLGTAGVNGSIIHNIQVKHVGVNPATTVKLFTKQIDDTVYYIENELNITAATASPTEVASPAFDFTLPKILPASATNTALHLAPECGLFAALTVSATDGLLVTVRGGDY